MGSDACVWIRSAYNMLFSHPTSLIFAPIENAHACFFLSVKVINNLGAIFVLLLRFFGKYPAMGVALYRRGLAASVTLYQRYCRFSDGTNKPTCGKREICGMLPLN